MNIFEKLLCSPYGRPWYEMITGRKVKRALWSSIWEMLVVEKGVLEAKVEDAKQDL